MLHYSAACQLTWIFNWVIPQSTLFLWPETTYKISNLKNGSVQLSSETCSVKNSFKFTILLNHDCSLMKVSVLYSPQKTITWFRSSQMKARNQEIICTHNIAECIRIQFIAASFQRSAFSNKKEARQGDQELKIGRVHLWRSGWKEIESFSDHLAWLSVISCHVRPF